MNPGNIPRIGEDGSAVTLDWTVLGFTLLLSLLTGVLFGLVPALHASRVDINSTLKEATSRSGSGMRQNKARSVLVIAEMALAIVLLVGAGLLHPHLLRAAQRGPRFRSPQRPDHGNRAHRNHVRSNRRHRPP